MVSNESQPSIQTIVSERLQAIEGQIRELQVYLALSQGGKTDTGRVVQLSEEERQAIRSVLESNSAIGPGPASALPGKKILIMVDPPGVCFDYTNF